MPTGGQRDSASDSDAAHQHTPIAAATSARMGAPIASSRLSTARSQSRESLLPIRYARGGRSVCCVRCGVSPALCVGGTLHQLTSKPALRELSQSGELLITR